MNKFIWTRNTVNAVEDKTNINGGWKHLTELNCHFMFLKYTNTMRDNSIGRNSSHFHHYDEYYFT